MDESTDLSSGAASRRAFLTGAGLAGAAVGVGVLAGPATAAPAARAYTSGKYAIELDGKAAGAPVRGGGGHAFGDVVEETAGADHVVHKHLAGVKYEDITVSCGTGMSKPFYEWIKNSFDRKFAGHSGKLTSWDSDGDVFDSVVFTDALITEVGFPALDGASKEAAKLAIQMQPESSKPASKPAAKLGVKQKAWLCSNFRLKIDNTDCSRVATIDSFTWKVAFTDDGKGTREPAHLEIPNLAITTPSSHSKEFYDWHEDFVLNGNSADERQGTLEFLRPDGQTVLFTLTFGGLGIRVVDAQPPTVDNIHRVKAEMYCETVSFDFSTAALA